MNESERGVTGELGGSGRASFSAVRAPDRETAWRACMCRIAARDQSSLTALYDDSSSLVYGLAVRMLGSAADAEEITIDVYAQVWRTAASYRESRGSVLSWLSTITRSRAIDRMRSRGPAARWEEPLSSLERMHARQDVENAAVRRIDVRRIAARTAILPEEQQRVLHLAYFSGMSHSEIADRLGVPIGTVTTRIRLGLTRLREIIEAKL